MAPDPKGISTARQWVALGPAERAAYRRALDAVSLVREGAAAKDAARRAGTTVETVTKYAGPALRRDARGRLIARNTDRLFRRLPVLTTKGIKEIDTTDSRVASEIGRHWSAIGHYLATGGENQLRAFRRRTIGDNRFETDADVIDQWEARGRLDFEDIYDLTR